jgi:hypothetical protein
MANTLLTTSEIMKRSLIVLENELTFSQNVNREYDDRFANTGAQRGATVNARKPPRYVGATTEALNIEATKEEFVPITLDKRAQVGMSFSSNDLTLHIEEFEKRIIRPAISQVANMIDADGLQLYKDVFRIVNHGANSAGYGTSGVLNGGSATQLGVQQQVLTAGAILTESGCPNDGQRAIVLDPASQVSVASSMLNLFNPSPKISNIFEKGLMSTNTLGFDWAADANVASFTPAASGAVGNATIPTSGATTLTVATNTATIPRGTIIKLTGVFAINPQSRQSTGRVMQFVVTQDVASGTLTIPIYPAFIPSTGTDPARATCTTALAIGAATAVAIADTGAAGAVGQSQNLAFHKDAFTLASADLVLPRGVDIGERESYKGISMRMVRQYDINSDQFPMRVDVLYGWKTVYPELAVRVGG